jgi:hypothetical protein
MARDANIVPTRADAEGGAWQPRRLTRATQWALMTVWPAGGQNTARSNALKGSPDEGYAADEGSRPER